MKLKRGEEGVSVITINTAIVGIVYIPGTDT